MGIVVFLVAVLLIPVLIYCAHDTSRLIWGRLEEGRRRGCVSAYRAHVHESEGQPTRWIEGIGLCVFLLGFLAVGRATGDEQIVYGLLIVVSVLAMLHAGLLVAAANALDAYDVSTEASDRGAVVA